jgi:hypothetical protein
MKEEDFSNLKDAIQGDDSLETLSSFAALLEQVVTYIIDSNNPNVKVGFDISWRLESIKNQKNIYECAERLYECVQSDEINKAEAEKKLESLKYACFRFKSFAEETSIRGVTGGDKVSLISEDSEGKK